MFNNSNIIFIITKLTGELRCHGIWLSPRIRSVAGPVGLSWSDADRWVVFYHWPGLLFLHGINHQAGQGCPGDPETFLFRGKRRPDGTIEGDQMEMMKRVAESGSKCLHVCKFLFCPHFIGHSKIWWRIIARFSDTINETLTLLVKTPEFSDK